MEYTQIIYSVDDHVATITLNRPDQLNAFTGTMMREIIDAFDQVDADDDVRAVIVTGAGRGFCAGQDLTDSAMVAAPGGDIDVGAVIEVGQSQDRGPGGRTFRRRGVHVPSVKSSVRCRSCNWSGAGRSCIH